MRHKKTINNWTRAAKLKWKKEKKKRNFRENLSLSRFDQQNQKGHNSPADYENSNARQIKVEFVRIDAEKVEYLFAVREAFHALLFGVVVARDCLDAGELIYEQVFARVAEPWNVAQH